MKQKALISYVFLKDLGANKEGDIVQLDSDEASELVEMGYLAEATADDVGGGDEEAEELAPVENAFSRISSKLEKIEAKVNKSTPKIAPPVYTVPAEVKKPEFKSLGEFAYNVFRAAKHDQKAHRRLLASKAAQGMSESVEADGGFLIPTEFASGIWDKVREQNSLLEKVTKFPVKTNNLTINALSETSRAEGSRWGGLRSYWIDEGNTITKSKPTFTRVTLALNKLCVMVYGTSELLEDNPGSLETYLRDLVPQEIAFRINDVFLNGGGTTEPTGVVGHASTVVVTKEAGQTASTINYQNLIKMYSRMYSRSLANAEWYINQEVFPQLFALAFPNASGSVPAYMPANGYINNAAYGPVGTLFGKPVNVFEGCAALGTVGDIIFGDFSQYGCIMRDPQFAFSQHLLFDTDDNAFRWIMRLDGRPMWTGALTPFKGSATTSPFVTLQTRS